MNCNRHNDHYQHNNNPQNETHSHLHIFPPHIFSHSVSTSSEPLGTDGQVVSLVFDRVQPLTSFGNLIDVVSHNTHRVVDLLW